MRREYADGVVIHPLYGIAYRDYPRCVVVCYPVPINLMVALWMRTVGNVWWRTRRGIETPLDHAYSEGRKDGFKAGEFSARKPQPPLIETTQPAKTPVKDANGEYLGSIRTDTIVNLITLLDRESRLKHSLTREMWRIAELARLAATPRTRNRDREIRHHKEVIESLLKEFV